MRAARAEQAATSLPGRAPGGRDRAGNTAYGSRTHGPYWRAAESGRPDCITPQ
jgi:hypothetical protein